MAELSAKDALILDADTLVDPKTGRRVRVAGIDAFESGTPEEARAQRITQTFQNRNPDAREVRQGEGFFGRTVSDFQAPDGTKLSFALAADPNNVVRDFNGGGSEPDLALANRAASFQDQASRLNPRNAPALNKERGLGQEFAAGVGRGIDTLQAGLYGSLAALGQGIEDESKGDPRALKKGQRNVRDITSAWLQRIGDSGFMRNVAEMRKNAPSEDFENAVTGDGNLLRWAAGALGEVLPSFAGLAAGAGVGGAVGAAGRAMANRVAAKKLEKFLRQDFGPRFNLPVSEAAKVSSAFVRNLPRYGAAAGGFGVGAGAESGHIFEEAKLKFGESSPSVAFTAGSIAGALDFVSGMGLLKSFMPKATEDAKRHLVTEMLKGLGLGTLREGSTEAVQEAINIIAVESQNPDTSKPLMERLITRENGWQVMAAAAAGSLFGGIVGSTGGLTSQLQDGIRARRKDSGAPDESSTSEADAAGSGADRDLSPPSGPGGTEAGALGVPDAEHSPETTTPDSAAPTVDPGEVADPSRGLGDAENNLSFIELLFDDRSSLAEAERFFKSSSVEQLRDDLKQITPLLQNASADSLMRQKYDLLVQIGREKANAVNQNAEAGRDVAQPNTTSAPDRSADRSSTEQSGESSGSRGQQSEGGLNERADKVAAFEDRSAQEPGTGKIQPAARVGSGDRKADARLGGRKKSGDRTDPGTETASPRVETSDAGNRPTKGEGEPTRADSGVLTDGQEKGQQAETEAVLDAHGNPLAFEGGIDPPDPVEQDIAEREFRNAVDPDGSVSNRSAEADREKTAGVGETKAGGSGGRVRKLRDAVAKAGVSVDDTAGLENLAAQKTVTVPLIAKAAGISVRKAGDLRKKLISNGAFIKDPKDKRRWIINPGLIDEGDTNSSSSAADSGDKDAGRVDGSAGSRTGKSGDSPRPTVVPPPSEPKKLRGLFVIPPEETPDKPPGTRNRVASPTAVLKIAKKAKDAQTVARNAETAKLRESIKTVKSEIEQGKRIAQRIKAQLQASKTEETERLKRQKETEQRHIRTNKEKFEAAKTLAVAKKAGKQVELAESNLAKLEQQLKSALTPEAVAAKQRQLGRVLEELKENEQRLKNLEKVTTAKEHNRQDAVEGDPVIDKFTRDELSELGQDLLEYAVRESGNPDSYVRDVLEAIADGAYMLNGKMRRAAQEITGPGAGPLLAKLAQRIRLRETTDLAALDRMTKDILKREPAPADRQQAINDLRTILIASFENQQESTLSRMLSEADVMVDQGARTIDVEGETTGDAEDLSFANGFQAYGKEGWDREVRHFAVRTRDKQVIRDGWRWITSYTYAKAKGLSAAANEALEKKFKQIRLHGGRVLLGKPPQFITWREYFEQNSEWVGLDDSFVDKLDDILRVRRGDGMQPGDFYIEFDAVKEKYYIIESWHQGTLEQSFAKHPKTLEYMPVADILTDMLAEAQKKLNFISDSVKLRSYAVTFETDTGPVEYHSQEIVKIGKLLAGAVTGDKAVNNLEAFFAGLDVILHSGKAHYPTFSDIDGYILDQEGKTVSDYMANREDDTQESIEDADLRFNQMMKSLNAFWKNQFAIAGKNKEGERFKHKFDSKQEWTRKMRAFKQAVKEFRVTLSKIGDREALKAIRNSLIVQWEQVLVRNNKSKTTKKIILEELDKLISSIEPASVVVRETANESEPTTGGRKLTDQTASSRLEWAVVKLEERVESIRRRILEVGTANEKRYVSSGVTAVKEKSDKDTVLTKKLVYLRDAEQALARAKADLAAQELKQNIKERSVAPGDEQLFVTEEDQAKNPSAIEGREGRATTLGVSAKDAGFTKDNTEQRRVGGVRRVAGWTTKSRTMDIAIDTLSSIVDAIPELRSTEITVYGLDDVKAILDVMAVADPRGRLEAQFKAKMEAGNATAVVFAGNRVHIYIDPRMRERDVAFAAAHELGHVIYRHLLQDMSRKSTIWKRLNTAYAKAGGEQLYSSKEEWFADQVARWARMGRKPHNILERMFKKAADAIRRLYLKVISVGKQSERAGSGPGSGALRARLEQRVPGNFNSVEAFMDGLVSREASIATRVYEQMMKDGIDPRDITKQFGYDFRTFQIAQRQQFWSTQPETDIAFLTGGEVMKFAHDVAGNNKVAGFARDVGVNLGKFARWTNNKLIKSADGWLRTQYNSEGAHLDEFRIFADMAYRQAGEAAGDPFTLTWHANGRSFSLRLNPGEEAYFEATRREYARWSQGKGPLKGFEDDLIDIPDDAMDIARQRFQAEEGVRPTDSPEVKAAYAKVRKLLDTFHATYLSKKVRNIGRFNKNFFHRVYDVSAIKRDVDGFHRVVTRHLHNWTRDDTEALIIAMETGHTFVTPDEINQSILPGMDAKKTRRFSKIPSKELMPYFSTDMMGIIRSYFHSSIKHAEWSDRFTYGPRSSSIIDRLVSSAKANGASQAQITEFRKITEAYLGRLGADLDPNVRKTMSWVQTYQNVRLLPMALLSQIIDMANPTIRSHLGLKASWAALNQALRAYKEKGGELWDMAATHGIVGDKVVADSMSQRLNAPYLSEGAQKFNDKFFRMIGMAQWTNFSRLYALEMGKMFLIEQVEKPGKFSERYLEELGVSPTDVKTWIRNGKKTWLVDSMSPEAKKVQLALNRFVDQSVFLPNAAERPSWASHPIWMLVWHLKQFAWSFAKVILGRAFREMKKRPELKDKLAVALPFLMVMPLAMLGMTIREWLKHEVLPWREGKPAWQEPTTTEYVYDAVRRSGVLGPLDLLLSAQDAQQWGNFFILSLLGPTASQIGDALSLKSPLNAVPLLSILPEERALVREWLN